MNEYHAKALIWPTLLLVTLGCENARRGDGVTTVNGPKTGDVPSSDNHGSVAPTSEDVSTAAEFGMQDVWDPRRKGDHKRVIEVTKSRMATGDLSYDDSGTCLFLQGDSYRQIGNSQEAKDCLYRAIREYPKSRYDDPNYGYIPVKPQCDVALQLLSERSRDRFPEKSADYAALAWTDLRRKRFAITIAMAEACIARFQDAAVEQQKEHEHEYGNGWPDLSSDPDENRTMLRKYWALYDVGTCFFILGQVYEKQGDMAREKQQTQEARTLYDRSVKCYDEVIRKYSGAQCRMQHDRSYWKVKRAAERQIDLINSVRLEAPGRS
jgi:tetratricopeptide (TPR) repeat protein